MPLGPETYLEIIGPDVAAAVPPAIFRLDRLATPRLVTWAAKGTDLPALAERARSSGLELGPVTPGSRLRPDGSHLSWELTDPHQLHAQGLVPFFIDWGASPHPAAAAPAAVSLEDFHAEHPTLHAIEALLGSLEVDLRVERGLEPRLVARLATPRGIVTLT